MINIQQITVQIEVRVPAHLHRSIRRLVGNRARREVEFCEYRERRERHFGIALGGEFFIVDNDVLDGRVRGLVPVRSEGRHGCVEVPIAKSKSGKIVTVTIWLCWWFSSGMFRFVKLSLLLVCVSLWLWFDGGLGCRRNGTYKRT